MIPLRGFRAAFSGARHLSWNVPARQTIAKQTLVGRLGAVPKLGQTSSGNPYLRFSIATNDRVGAKEDGTPGEPRTSWHTVFSFHGTENDFLKSLESGTLVHVDATFSKSNEKLPSGEFTEKTYVIADKLTVLARPQGHAT